MRKGNYWIAERVDTETFKQQASASSSSLLLVNCSSHYVVKLSNVSIGRPKESFEMVPLVVSSLYTTTDHGPEMSSST